MRRLLRYTLDGLTLLSAVLFVAVVVLWVRSYRAVDSVLLPPSQSRARVHVASYLGRLDLLVTHTEPPLRQEPHIESEPLSGLTRVGLRWHMSRIQTRAGFGFHREEETYTEVDPGEVVVIPVPEPGEPDIVLGEGDDGGRRVSITRQTIIAPHWFLAALAAALPAARLVRRFRRHRRTGDGLCPRCGYDLRATPEKCPECGAAAAEGVP